jgi:hypothetical protein
MLKHLPAGLQDPNKLVKLMFHSRFRVVSTKSVRRLRRHFYPRAKQVLMHASHLRREAAEVGGSRSIVCGCARL